MEKSPKHGVSITTLPEFNWDLVGLYLPTYDSRQDVADNDSLHKFLDGEYDYQDPDDFRSISNIVEGYSNIELERDLSDRLLLREAALEMIKILDIDIDRLHAAIKDKEEFTITEDGE